ncbi:accessory factor UbiK family protein [Halopseudomonas nanhaiensis]|uniref:accessory factor UbiK family protein n=1 Tax=Halopseudomonas nanhaiensis TaxID=2830842 RepID=UPI001CBC218E|nr:accessory factor UbiK family protein [Halopseudomonas nanhaiensis]UAW98516.1 accessory factor UbiK family protein [Halopseudomonas nanhaiensis]
MLPKDFIDAVTSQASRLFSGEHNLPGPELEKRVKAVLQSALSRLDVVSREEFETQQVVLMRTRERLEALEKRVAEMERTGRSDDSVPQPPA